MFKIVLLIATASAAVTETPLCAYWCESHCTIKATSFYCCSFEPSFTGPKEFLEPPCKDLCLGRPRNNPSFERNCKTEIEELTAVGSFKICKNFRDCDPNVHDLCCTDNCLPEKRKMCISL